VVLAVEDVVSGYGGLDILHGVSLRAAAGEIVSIVGPNGAGKSTLARVIFGLLPLRRGRVTFEGRDLAGVPPYQRPRLGMAYTPQEESIFRQLTVRENLELGAYLHWGPRSALEQRLEEIYRLFPRLRERSEQVSGTLSGGERQMLALGRALMSKPELLVVDEPSLGLQPNLVAETLEKIVEINREHGVTIVMIEQAAPKALEISDRVYVMAMGEIQFAGAPEELRDNREIGELYLRG
jgi:ABC-type branched-subunit amino acid transport system ATPase component